MLGTFIRAIAWPWTHSECNVWAWRMQVSRVPSIDQMARCWYHTLMDCDQFVVWLQKKKKIQRTTTTRKKLSMLLMHECEQSIGTLELPDFSRILWIGSFFVVCCFFVVVVIVISYGHNNQFWSTCLEMVPAWFVSRRPPMTQHNMHTTIEQHRVEIVNMILYVFGLAK